MLLPCLFSSIQRLPLSRVAMLQLSNLFITELWFCSANKCTEVAPWLNDRSQKQFLLTVLWGLTISHHLGEIAERMRETMVCCEAMFFSMVFSIEVKLFCRETCQKSLAHGFCPNWDEFSRDQMQSWMELRVSSATDTCICLLHNLVCGLSGVHRVAGTYGLDFTYLVLLFLLAGAQELAVWLPSISPWV